MKQNRTPEGIFSPARPRSADEFWSDFRSRSLSTDRVPYVRPRPRGIMPLGLAAALVLAAFIWMRREGPIPAAALDQNSRIESLNVLAAHDGVFIMPLDGGGVMVWIGMGDET